MGIFRSPNIVLDGLAFGYDADDRSPRFYPGKPINNLLQPITLDLGFNDGPYFKSNYGTEVVNIPAIGNVISNYCNIYNDNANSGNCCPRLFGYGSVYNILPNTSYTYQIIYKTSTGYYSQNYMYHYEYNDGTYITEYGLLDISRTESLGDGWIHGWGTFTTQSTTNRFPSTGFWHYEYNTHDKVQLAGIMLTQGTTIYSPRQFVLPATSRDAYHSLIDLTHKVSIDVSNINFDIHAYPIFDGTDDFLKIGNEQLIHRTSNFSYNIWMNQTSTDGTDTLFENGFWSSSFLIRLEGGTSIAIYSMSAYWGAFSFTPLMNVWYYLSFVREGNTLYFYINGVYQSSMGFTADIQPNTNYLYVGASQHSTPQGFIGKLPVVHIYNKALSSAEVMQNFLALRERFIKIGESPLYPAISALEIKQRNPSALDGVYWIDLPTVGPTRTYCLLDSKYNGGGWMMVMKATRGTTFQYDANYWTTNNTLNPTDLTRNDADAKYDVMNYYNSKDIMALWPDITTDGGSISGLGIWSWLENNFYGGNKITPVGLFSSVDRYFIRDAKTFSGWASGIFSSQTDVRFYGFNFHNNGNWSKTRWGFGWNENGGGLYPNGDMNSDDVSGGIGMSANFGNYSAGDRINCCQDSAGINRSARVEIYVR